MEVSFAGGLDVVLFVTGGADGSLLGAESTLPQVQRKGAPT